MAAISGTQASKLLVDQALQLASGAMQSHSEVMREAPQAVSPMTTMNKYTTSVISTPMPAAFLQAAILSSLQMLVALAEEANRLEWNRRQTLVLGLQDALPSVLTLVQGVLLSGLHATLPVALTCLDTWLKLDPSAKGECCLSPGELRAAAPHLMLTLIHLMGSPDSADGGTAVVGEIVSAVLGPGKMSAQAEADHKALRVRG